MDLEYRFLDLMKDNNARWLVARAPLHCPLPRILVAEQVQAGTAGPQLRSSQENWFAVDLTHVNDIPTAMRLLKIYLQEFPLKRFLFLTTSAFPITDIPYWFGEGALLEETDGQFTLRSLGADVVDDSRLLQHSRKLTPRYDLSQLILHGRARLRLNEAVSYVRTKAFCEDDWGFRETHSRGHGVTMLFHGPSGTGKTMAAEAVASELSLPLYQIDLSSIFSKWVGETEKNLKAIFRAAEGVRGILLFDEGDAIFGKRTQVSDGQDRYGNLEVNYLLQEIEVFNGVAILSTNDETNMDPAFLRRFAFTIGFAPPSASERERIWKANLPVKMPLGTVDFTHLSRFPLTGGNIRNCVRVAAARAASQQKTDVDQLDFLWAIKRELQKHGEDFERGLVGEQYWRSVGPDWEFLLLPKGAPC